MCDSSDFIGLRRLLRIPEVYDNIGAQLGAAVNKALNEASDEVLIAARCNERWIRNALVLMSYLPAPTYFRSDGSLIE